MAVSLSLSVSESDVSKANNTSVVKAVLKAVSTSGSWNHTSPYGYLTIDGTKYEFHHNFDSNVTTTLITKSKTVKHEADGSKSVTVKGYFKTGVSSGNISKTVTKTLTKITRQWTVSYNANGGSGAPSSQTKTYGTTLTLSSTKPTRTGYDFAGWATSASGSVAYSAGGSYTSNAAVTLYAVWTPKTSAVSFVNSHGSTVTSTAKHGSTFTFPTLSNIAGYEFQGWSNTSGGTVSYYGGQSITWSTSYPTTWYAVWKVVFRPASILTDSMNAARTPSMDSENVRFRIGWTKGDGAISKVTLYYKRTVDSTYTRFTEWTNVSAASIDYTSVGNLFNKDESYDVKWEIKDANFVDPIVAYDIITRSSFIWQYKDGVFTFGVPVVMPEN